MRGVCLGSQGCQVCQSAKRDTQELATTIYKRPQRIEPLPLGQSSIGGVGRCPYSRSRLLPRVISQM